jgi:hypothetical protein
MFRRFIGFAPVLIILAPDRGRHLELIRLSRSTSLALGGRHPFAHGLAVFARTA